MKKLLFIACAIAGATIAARSATLIEWNTFGNTGTETTEPSVTNIAGLQSSNLTLGAGISGSTNGNRFGGDHWFDTGDTGAAGGGTTLLESIGGNDYIEFIVTPNAGFQFTLTSLVFDWERSATGPSSITLRSSADAFVTDLGTVSGLSVTLNNYTLTISGLGIISTPTTFRVYGYGATGAAGSGGFDTSTNAVNVQLNGNVVPEPTVGAMFIGGIAILAVLHGRRRLVGLAS